MLTVEEQQEVLRKYFTEISPEEFQARLRKCSPELFEKPGQKSKIPASDTRPRSRLQGKHRRAARRP